MKFKINSRKKIAFTFVEVMVVLGLFSFVTLGIFTGAIQISKQLNKSRSYITARKTISVFCQALYSFTNKSYAVFFWDNSSSAELDYLTEYPLRSSDDPVFDNLFFVKDEAETKTGVMIYNPTSYNISWIKESGATPQILLEDVYRIDYESESNKGNASIFRFPHKSSLYEANTRPLFVIIEFKKKVMNITAQNKDPLMIPIKLMAQVNTTN